MKCYLAICIVQILIFRIEIGHCSLQALFRREEGKYLANNVIRTEQAVSELDCAALCSRERSCVSVNYKISGENEGICDLNNKSLEESEQNGRAVPEFVNLGIVKRDCKTKEKQFCPEPPLYKKCSELRSKAGSKTNGEYKLHLNFPRCDKAVDVYCDDMDTPNPKEYITLKAGEANNFSKKDWVGTGNTKVSSSTTNFAKIRIIPDLSVVRDDFKFSKITWSYNGLANISFASGWDCMNPQCFSTKKGLFKMDLTGTGLRFVTPIFWKFSGYPNTCQGRQPVDYKIDNGNQVVSGNCGGYCGGCYASDLSLQIIGCEE